MRTRNFLLSLSILMTTTSVWAQDFTLNIPPFEHNYVIPVDTMSRKLYIGQEFMDWSWEGGLWQLEFTFHNNGPRPIVYTIAGIIQGSWDVETLDTLDFQATSLSMVDTLRTGQFITPNGMASGFQYVDMPGDSISGVTMDFAPDTVGSGLQYHTLWYRADTLSDWRPFQPLALGNVWKYGGSFPVYSRTRLEVIDTMTSSDTIIYTVSRQREYLEDYGEGVIEDTGRVYTVTGQRYQIQYYDGTYINPIGIDFQPFDPPNSYGTFDRIILYGDGNIDYGIFSLYGPGAYWRYGVGFHLSTGDPYGILTNLIGYRVGDEAWGDVDILVGIAELPQIPEEYQLTAYPNPFNPTTTIRYTIPENNKVIIKIFDQSGRQVNQLVSAKQNAGEYTTQWNGRDDTGQQLASGLYFCQIRSGDFSRTFKLILLK